MSWFPRYTNRKDYCIYSPIRQLYILGEFLKTKILKDLQNIKNLQITFYHSIYANLLSLSRFYPQLTTTISYKTTMYVCNPRPVPHPIHPYIKVIPKTSPLQTEIRLNYIILLWPEETLTTSIIWILCGLKLTFRAYYHTLNHKGSCPLLAFAQQPFQVELKGVVRGCRISYFVTFLIGILRLMLLNWHTELRNVREIATSLPTGISVALQCNAISGLI